MQDIFGTTLPPTTMPIEEMTDYDIIRSAFNEMCKAEGMKAEWKPGQDPPEKVREWWGNEDFDVFRLYQNSNITPDMMNLVRTKYPHYQKNAIHFFRRKIKSCYELRLGAELAAKFHMKLKKEELEEIKQEKFVGRMRRTTTEKGRERQKWRREYKGRSRKEFSWQWKRG